MVINIYSGLDMVLCQGVKDFLFVLFYVVLNVLFDKLLDQSFWVLVFIMGNQFFVVILGNEGQDVYDGILQIDLNYLFNIGEVVVMVKVDELIDYFKVGK